MHSCWPQKTKKRPCGRFFVCILAETVGALIGSPDRILSRFCRQSLRKGPQESPQTDQLAFVRLDRAQRSPSRLLMDDTTH